MHRSRNSAALLSAGIVLIALSASSAAAQLNLPRPSPKATISQTVGVSDVTITYSRPSLRGRAIWGALVPWEKVWRTGANEVTTISVTDDVLVEGQKLAAGTYSLHSIPGQSEWTFIFNKAVPPSGYSYDAAQDALRIKVKPQSSTHSHELLTFEIPTVSEEAAEVALLWEKVRVPFRLAVDTDAYVLANAREAVAKAEADDWRTSFQAANYAHQAELKWPEATSWIDRSIAANANYTNLGLKARMLARQGKTSEAIQVGKRAVEAGKASAQKVDTASMEKLLAEWSAKK
jgi:hypothetical protein